MILKRAWSAAVESLPVLLILTLLIVIAMPFLQRAGVFGTTVRVALDPAADEDRELRMVTLLPKDGISAIFDPTFVSAAEANERFFASDDLVIGVEIEGDARAYGIAYLSGHEIVNDVVGGRPIAVTW